MNRSNDVQFNQSAMETQPASVDTPGHLKRIPRGFKEAMEYILERSSCSSNNPANMSDAPKSAMKPAPKWKSTFKPLEDEDEDNSSPVESTSSPQRVDLYDPYNPSSESDSEMMDHLDNSHSHMDQDDNQEHQQSPRHSHHTLFHSRADQRAYSPDTEASGSRRLLDHRVSSPDRPVCGSSTQRPPESYGAQWLNGDERITFPEHRRELPTMTATGRSCTSTLQRDYQHHLKMGLDEIEPSFRLNRNRSKQLLMNKNPVTCDLCFVEFSNCQELQDHLESKTHWDTLELIQRENDYDDLAIAFLQEVMLHRSRQCSRAVEDSVLKVLQEYDHMKKIEIFHCAACDIFVAASASSVETHVTSHEHFCNTKEFRRRQRFASLHKAETMMKDLKPQFESFLKGGNLFE